MGNELCEIRMNIDWTLLRRQKKTLVALAGVHGKKAEVGDAAAGAVADDLEGIINLLDGLQDAAVSSHGVPEHVVFGPGGCE